MTQQPATKRSVALVIAMAMISVGCLALATRAGDKYPGRRMPRSSHAPFLHIGAATNAPLLFPQPVLLVLGEL